MTKPAWATDTWDAGTGPMYTATLDADCTGSDPNTLEPVRLGVNLLAYPPDYYPRPLVFVRRSDQPRPCFGLTATEAHRLAAWLDHAAYELEHERTARHD